jgi:hypothetical protein
VKLYVAEHAPRTEFENPGHFSNPIAWMLHPEMKIGAQAMVSLRDGLMDQLEMASYEDDCNWPSDESAFTVHPDEWRRVPYSGEPPTR